MKAAEHRMRVFLTCLALFAAFAFQTRMDGVNLDLKSFFFENQIALTWCGPVNAQLDQTEIPINPFLQKNSDDSSGHLGHEAHCSFCISNAFALEVVPPVLPHVPAFIAKQSRTVPIRLQTGPLDDPRARAPPSI